MTSELVKRLMISEDGLYRDKGWGHVPVHERNSVMREAAAEITRLTAALEEAEKRV